MRAIAALLDKGVNIPIPLSLDIGAEVDVDRISADGVTIHPRVPHTRRRRLGAARRRP
jgi:hypothetical protein